MTLMGCVAGVWAIDSWICVWQYDCICWMASSTDELCRLRKIVLQISELLKTP